MKSPIKWVGGKRNEIKYFEQYLPDFKTYVEPFFGGGALYWHLQPKNAIINDINHHLINFYKVLASDYNELIIRLQEFINSESYFKDVVNRLNSEDFKDEIDKAAVFYYINKTCFSGKWRVNSEGKFNNTFGFYKNDNYKSIDSAYSNLLKDVKIFNADFKDIFDQVQYDSSSFLFLDPPYLDCDAMYTAGQKFDDIYKYIVHYMYFAKCKVMLVVKSTDYLEDLFKNRIIGRYKVNYRHNSVSNKKHEHLIITNYQTTN